MPRVSLSIERYEQVLVHRTDAFGNALWSKTYTNNTRLKDDAGEFIITTRAGGYAVYVDSQTWGSPSTRGNFAFMKLKPDVAF